MSARSPNIDQRTAGEIAKQVQTLLKVYTPDWKEFDPTGQPTGVSAALIGVFARLSELIIQRLNEAPQKNFLAFLDLLGASRLPPQPARVPLTFFLAAGSAVDGLVLAGTQVAAPPLKGEKDPVIFETERELVVTAAQLAALFVRDPEQDQQADRSPIITSGAASSVLMFRGEQPIDHILYLGHSRLFGFSHISNARLTFTLEGSALQDTRVVQWELWDGFLWQSQVPVAAPNVRSLMVSGALNFGAVAPIPETELNTVRNRWMRARLVTPITIDTTPRLNMVRATDLPHVRTAILTVDLLRALNEGLSPDAAFANATQIDVGKDFFPFGEKPKSSDVLYLASAEAFSKDRAGGLAATGARVNLQIDVANTHLLQTESSVYPSPDLQLAWECWNGQSWQQVGTSSTPDWLSLLELDPLPETTTQATVVITGRVQRGAALGTQTLQGLVAGAAPRVLSVGTDGRFSLTIPGPPPGLNLIAFTASLGGRVTTSWAVFFRDGGNLPKLGFTAPALVTGPIVNVIVRPSGVNAALVTRIRITNGDKVPFEGAPNVPLPVTLDEGRNHLLFEGLSAAGDRLTATTTIVSRQAAAPLPQPSGFIDGTYAFCQDGTVTLTLPDEVAKTSIGGQENFWLRVRIIKGDYGRDASYRLKNPAAPEDGFTLVLETFRAPHITGVIIGYQQTLSGRPELMFALNNSTFESVSNAGPSDPAFEPFRRAPEDRPTFYAGFTLPPDQAVFPNSPITLYAHIEGLKYGEKVAPISPDQSKEVTAVPVAAPPTIASHKFVVTNPATIPVTYSFSIFGTRWTPAPVAPAPMTVPAGGSASVEVRVTVPAGTPPGSSDEGFLQLTSANDPGSEHTASFITFVLAEPPTGEQLRLVWEYWNRTSWSILTVRDDTENFTRPGLIEFLAPPDFSPSAEFGLSPRFWLRVRWEKGEYVAMPRLTRLLPNTTIAAQTVTIPNETLGSSDASESQKFRSTLSPVLFGQRLEVREPELPSAAELELIRETGDLDPVTIISDAAGRAREYWVHWQEVPDFYGSGPRDRHYVLDHLTGELTMGDGLNGLKPPAGIGNVRLARYQTGGGSAGNKPAGAIVQLKTTVPYVDKVTNPEAAAGGADAETLDSLITRAPRSIRHSSRAVTVEDYEDLAMLASPEVARAKCVALRNLVDDPLDVRPRVRGEVSVIIVPRSRDAKPVPSLELLSRVQDYLEARSVPTSRVSVVGPLYIRVDVKVEIALVSLEGASAVQQATQEKIAAFLHPLTGGLDGTGWDFGREAHESDLYALIESVPGVDHVRSLEKVETEDPIGVRTTGRFLVFSGTHTISLVFESD